MWISSIDASGEHVAEDEERVVVDEADVRQPAFGDAVADHAVVVQRLLDADEIHIRLRRRRGDQKASLARSDLQHHAALVSEQLREVEADESGLRADR